MLNQPNSSVTPVTLLIDDIWLDIMKPPKRSRTHRGCGKNSSKTNQRNSEERRRHRFTETRRFNKHRNLPRQHKHYNDADVRKPAKFKSSFKDNNFRNKFASKLLDTMPIGDYSCTDSDSALNDELSSKDGSIQSDEDSSKSEEGAVVNLVGLSECKQLDAVTSKAKSKADKERLFILSKPTVLQSPNVCSNIVPSTGLLTNTNDKNVTNVCTNTVVVSDSVRAANNCEPVESVNAVSTCTEVVKIKSEPVESFTDLTTTNNSTNAPQVDERLCFNVRSFNTVNSDRRNAVAPMAGSVAVKEEVIDQSERVLPSPSFSTQSQTLNPCTLQFCSNTNNSVMPVFIEPPTSRVVNEVNLSEKINSVLLIDEESSGVRNAVDTSNNKLQCFTRERVLSSIQFVRPNITLPGTVGRSSSSVQQFNVIPTSTITLKSQAALFDSAKISAQNSSSFSTPATVLTNEIRGHGASISNPDCLVFSKQAVNKSSASSPLGFFNNLKRNSNNKLLVGLGSSVLQSKNFCSPNFSSYTQCNESRSVFGPDGPSCSNSGFNVLKTSMVFSSRSNTTPIANNTMLYKPSDLVNLKMIDKSTLPENTKGQTDSSSLNMTRSSQVFVSDSLQSLKHRNNLVTNVQCIPSSCLSISKQQSFSKNIVNNGNLLLNTPSSVQSTMIDSSTLANNLLRGLKSSVAFSVPIQSTVCNTIGFGNPKPATGIEIPSQEQESVADYLEANRHIMAENNGLTDAGSISKISLAVPIACVEDRLQGSSSCHDPPVVPGLQETCVTIPVSEHHTNINRGSCRAAGNIASFLCVCDDHHSPESSCAMTPVDNNCCTQQTEARANESDEQLRTNESDEQNYMPVSTAQSDQEDPVKLKNSDEQFTRLDSYTLKAHATINEVNDISDGNHATLSSSTSYKNDLHSSTERNPENNLNIQSSASKSSDDNFLRGHEVERNKESNSDVSDGSLNVNVSTKRKHCTEYKMTVGSHVKRTKYSELQEDDGKDLATDNSTSEHNTSDDRLVIDEEYCDEYCNDSREENSSPDAPMNLSRVANKIEVSPKNENTSVSTKERTCLTISKSQTPENKPSRSHSDKKFTTHEVSEIPSPESDQKKVPILKIKKVRNTTQVETDENGEHSFNSSKEFVCESSINSNEEFICESFVGCNKEFMSESCVTKRVKNKRKHRDREHHSQHHSRHRSRTISQEEQGHDQEAQTVPKPVSYEMNQDGTSLSREAEEVVSEQGVDSTFHQPTTSTQNEQTITRTGYDESDYREKPAPVRSVFRRTRSRKSSRGEVEQDPDASYSSGNLAFSPSDNNRESSTDRLELRDICKNSEISPQDDSSYNIMNSVEQTVSVDIQWCNDSEGEVNLLEMVMVKHFQMTRAEANKLHVATCEIDRRLCMSQFKFRDYFSESYDVSTSIPVPYPSYFEEIVEVEGEKPSRCPCVQCSENMCVLLANYKKLTQYRNTRLTNEVEFRKHQNEKLIRQIERSLEEPDSEESLKVDSNRWSANNTPEPECSLPLKKRKTFTHLLGESSDSSNNQPEKHDVSVESNPSTSEDPRNEFNSELPSQSEMSQPLTEEPQQNQNHHRRQLRSSMYGHSSRRSYNEENISYDSIEGNNSNSSASSSNHDIYSQSYYYNHKENSDQQSVVQSDSSLCQENQRLTHGLETGTEDTSLNMPGPSADTNMAVETLLNFAYNVKHNTAELNLNTNIVPSTHQTSMLSSNVLSSEHERQTTSSDSNDFPSSRHERDPRIKRKRNRNKT